MSIFLGRQPILDTSRRRHGYELLYRSGQADAAFFADPHDATKRVVEQALLEWGLVDLVGDGIAFINVTPEFLDSGLYEVLPSEQVVFEIRASAVDEPGTVDAVRRAVRDGYRVALDDVVEACPVGLADMAPYVEIVKVDVQGATLERVADLVAMLQRRAPNALLLAERVETLEAFEHCRKLGFELFQGYFFARPEVVQRAARPISRQGAVGLMAALQDPALAIDDLVDLASADPTLTYRLLRLVNASSTGLANRIDSVRHAIVLLGLDHVRQLATLLTMAGSASTNRELLTLAVTRAHMVRQLLAERPEAAQGFTTGMLSVIDALFGAPMDELLADLPVHDAVREALLHRRGPIGEVMQLVHAHEQADVAELERLGDIDLAAIRAAYGHSSARAVQLDHHAGAFAEPVGTRC